MALAAWRLPRPRRWLADPTAWIDDWDITDHARMADLRARLAGAVILAGSVPAVRGILTDRAGDAAAIPGEALLLVPMPLVGAFLLWRRGRVGETVFALSLASVCVLVGIVRLRTGQVGSVAAQDVTFLIPVILGAVFFARHRALAVQTLTSVAMSAADTWHRLSREPSVVQVLVANAFTFIVVALVIRLLRELADRAVRQARIGEVTDPLTGLLNRRGFERAGVESWQHRAQEHLPLVLLVVDVDHFKRVNDTLGHSAGDELLRRIGMLLQSALRDGDHAFRLGGEEFAILARCRPGEAPILAERVRALVEKELPAAVSIGAVEIHPEVAIDPTQTLWDVVDRADTGLYAAKAAGRNTVRVVDARS